MKLFEIDLMRQQLIILIPLFGKQQINIRMKTDLSTLNPLSNIFLNLPSKKSNPSTQASINKLPPGAKTIGNYLLGKNIGQGTFGKAHMALHLPTSEKVAIKIIDKSKMRPKDVQRVLKEIEVLKRIRHRHVVTLYEIMETEKSLLLVTEFLPNGELFRHIIKEKKIAEDQACVFFQQIIQAVDYLHRNKIAHRDLKPENILIDYDKQLKVIDFGLSAIYKGKQRLQTFCGSPCYAAPQIVEARQGYTPLQTDLWSCGVILYAMLCGHLPFCDVDTHTLFKKILAGNYKIPTNISVDAQNLIQRLLVVAPQKRITIEEIREHKWFNRVLPSPAYGVDFEQQLPADKGILQKMATMGINDQKMAEQVLLNEKNKDMATYLILMKKLVKNGQLIPSYFGNDNFNPKLILRQEIFPDQQDTDPQSNQTLIQGPDAQTPIKNLANPLPGCDYYADEKDIDETELMELLGGILDLFFPTNIPSKSALSLINEVLAQSDHSHLLRKLTQQKKESEFYAHNKDNAKKQFEFTKFLQLREKKPKVTDSLSIAAIYRNEIRSSTNRYRTTTEMEKSPSKRQKTAPKKIVALQNLQDPKYSLPFNQRKEQLCSNRQKKLDSLFPSLSQKNKRPKGQEKFVLINRRYKLFKNYLQ